jgi:serine acetyltransferase
MVLQSGAQCLYLTVLVDMRTLDGVRVGRNAIVSTDSVVAKFVPINATVAGLPVRLIGQR